MNPAEPYCETREHARGRVVGSDQQQMQQVAGRHRVTGTQIRRRRGADVGALDDDFARQVRRVLEEDHRGHHLRDAGDRTAARGVALPEHLAVFRVVDDGGFGADIGNDVAEIVELEARLDRLTQRGCLLGRPHTRGAHAARGWPLCGCGRFRDSRLLDRRSSLLLGRRANGCARLRRNAHGGESRRETEESKRRREPGSDHRQTFVRQIVTVCFGILADNL